jgi:restriction endonuclease S subunit
VKGNTHNKQILEVLPIICPSLEKQREIVIKLDKAFSEIESLRSQSRVKQISIDALRQSLLSDAFTEMKGAA